MPVVLALSGLVGCGTERADVEIDGVELTLGIERLDQDLFHSGIDSVARLNEQLNDNYGEFYRVYLEQILQMPPYGDPRLPFALESFISDPDWQVAQASVDSVLGDLSVQQVQFTDAFKRLKVLFPERITPRVVTFNSGYNYGIFPTDSVLGIGVEWFIGPDHPVIGYLAPDRFPRYVKERMRPDMMVPSAVKGWLLVHYTRDIRGADLLTNLVETGKVMALLDVLLPDVATDLKFTFSPEQLDWCVAKEYNIWKEMVAKEMLFTHDDAVIGRIMNDGPFTSGFPRESPGHVGEWIGHRIVSAYLKENPDVSYADLLAMDDPNVILKSYKPR